MSTQLPTTSLNHRARLLKCIVSKLSPAWPAIAVLGAPQAHLASCLKHLLKVHYSPTEATMVSDNCVRLSVKVWVLQRYGHIRPTELNILRKRCAEIIMEFRGFTMRTNSIHAEHKEAKEHQPKSLGLRLGESLVRKVDRAEQKAHSYHFQSIVEAWFDELDSVLSASLSLRSQERLNQVRRYFTDKGFVERVFSLKTTCPERNDLFHALEYFLPDVE